MVGDQLTILVADDSAGCRDLYTLWLPADHDVLTAADGQEALDLLRPDVDLVIVDREMPGLGGVAVARELRDRDHDADVVMVSSRRPDLDLGEYPIDDYRQKPLMESDLRDIVTEYRTRQEYQTALEQFFALTAKVAALEASMPAAELEESERYARLRWLVEEKRAEVDEALSDAASNWSTAFKACTGGAAEGRV